MWLESYRRLNLAELLTTLEPDLSPTHITPDNIKVDFQKLKFIMFYTLFIRSICLYVSWTS